MVSTITKQTILDVRAEVKVIFRDISSQYPENELRKKMIDKYPTIRKSYNALAKTYGIEKAGWLGMISIYPEKNTKICQIFAQSQSRYKRRAKFTKTSDFVKYNHLETALRSLKYYVRDNKIKTIAFEEGFGVSSGSNGDATIIYEMIDKCFNDVNDLKIIICNKYVEDEKYPELLINIEEDSHDRIEQIEVDADGIIIEETRVRSQGSYLPSYNID